MVAHRQMVRHWTLTPAFQGSNPCGPANGKHRINDKIVSAMFFWFARPGRALTGASPEHA